MILDHLWLVRHIVGKLAVHLPPRTDVENLESAGTLGLVEAATKFDPGRGVQFQTFAYTRIRGAVLDELRRNCPLPQQVLEQVAKVREAYEQMPPGVTLEALAAATGLSVDEVSDCLVAMRLTRMLSWEGSPKLLETEMMDRQTQPDALAEQAEEKQLLTEAIESLPPRERLVVTLYYKEDLRLKEIGEVMQLSESRVSRLLSAGLFQIGEYLRTHGHDGDKT